LFTLGLEGAAQGGIKGRAQEGAARRAKSGTRRVQSGAAVYFGGRAQGGDCGRDAPKLGDGVTAQSVKLRLRKWTRRAGKVRVHLPYIYRERDI